MQARRPRQSARQGIEGTANNMMGKCVVPSIRRVKDWWCDGGLEAHQDLWVMIFAVLPSSPYR
jgi:hypothetical protein